MKTIDCQQRQNIWGQRSKGLPAIVRVCSTSQRQYRWAGLGSRLSQRWGFDSHQKDWPRRLSSPRCSTVDPLEVERKWEFRAAFHSLGQFCMKFFGAETSIFWKVLGNEIQLQRKGCFKDAVSGEKVKSNRDSNLWNQRPRHLHVCSSTTYNQIQYSLIFRTASLAVH